MDKLVLQLENLKQNEPLKNHTSLKIGGPAKWFYETKNIADFVKAVKLARELKINYFILGGGTNILINDQGIDGLVIKNSCDEIRLTGNKITTASGTKLAKVTDAAINAGLSGLEKIGNIPGTIGGAVWGNAGAYGVAIGDFVTRAKILTANSEIKEVDNNYFKFSYRDSILKHNQDLLLEVELEFKQKGNPDEMKKIRKEELDSRIKKQPQGIGTAGCFFKNLIVTEDQIEDNPVLLKHWQERDRKDIAAGFLIDQAGLKGFKVGDAMVSDVHTNFLVNTGNATACDMLELIETVNKQVFDKFGLKLEREVYLINQKGVKEQ
jgi:UDP-N-acetylmuramate dehydrogenase